MPTAGVIRRDLSLVTNILGDQYLFLGESKKKRKIGFPVKSSLRLPSDGDASM